MAEAERVLREISVVATCTHLDLSLARAMPNPLPLDQGLDFIVHDDGMIELTEAGFRRMRQAYSAGLDTVIKIDGRDVFRFPVSPSRSTRFGRARCHWQRVPRPPGGVPSGSRLKQSAHGVLIATTKKKGERTVLRLARLR